MMMPRHVLSLLRTPSPGTPGEGVRRAITLIVALSLLSNVARAQSFSIADEATYTKDRGHGFDQDTKPDGDKPWFFSVAAPEGNYNVTLVFGDPKEASATTVKAESRRLMLENVKTQPGKFETRTITVNVRTSQIAGDGQVRLKPREKEKASLDWDEKLTLEFSGPHPRVQSIRIEPDPDAITVYIAGDSTVTDQTLEPYNSWGQMLPRWFNPGGVAIANHAESGETLRAFQGEKRLDKIMSQIKRGDYLFIQFGHNDEKEKGEGVGAFTTFKASLVHYVELARSKGAIPVVITPVQRQTFDSNGKITNSHGDYPDAVRQVAKEQNVALIDLHAMTTPLYEAWGPADAPKAFAPKDKTHHNNYGSYEIAKCVVEGIRQDKLDLVKFIVDDFKGFDPGKPDPIESFDVPADPMLAATTKPEGN
jgi:lysophospholipase L1-like esterase